MTHSFRAFADAPTSRIDEHGFDRYLFFGVADQLVDGPQAYMNDLDPGIELAAHFHKVDQFQVFFGGAGARFRRHEIDPVLVHYTDAYATYGPFSSGAQGRLLYATMRAQHSNFGGVMPGARDELAYRGTRNLSWPVEDWELDRIGDGGTRLRSVYGPDDDGLGCTLALIAAGDSTTFPIDRPIGGRYYCVLAGEVVVGGAMYPERSLGWSGHDDPSLELLGGPEGASVLALDFPWPPTQESRLAELAASQ